MNDQIFLNRLKDTNENVQFLSATITGLIKKLNDLEKTLERHHKDTLQLQDAVIMIAEELEMVVDHEPAHS